jgi:hypothetical protein
MRNKLRVLVQMVGDDAWYLGRVKDAKKRLIKVENGPWAGMVAAPHQYFAWKRTP